MYIGIDLGTTNSTIAGMINQKWRIFKTSEGTDTLPSAIYIDKRKHKLYGKKAQDQAVLSSENVATGFKRLMGTSTEISFKLAEISMTPEECSAEILKQLMSQAYTETGTNEVEGVIVTIPAAFDQMQVEATIKAATMAGITKVALLQEPIAAAMAATAQSEDKNGQFLIYDLGGGTFDLALAQSVAGTFNIITHEGINMLGGRDFDRAIVDKIVRPWMLGNFALPNNFHRQGLYKRVLSIAQMAAEKAKIELSSSESATIFASDDELRTQDDQGGDIYLEVPITRTDLEAIIAKDIEKTIKLSKKIIKNNGYTNKDINRIVLVGGPTKMPYVRRILSERLNIPVDCSIDPMSAVAIGAAIYCESREWSQDETSPKKTRVVQEITGSDQAKIELNCVYQTRTSSPTAKIGIRANDKYCDGVEVAIESSSGWSSGYIPLTANSLVEAPLPEVGEHSFTIKALAPDGKTIHLDTDKFIITRTLATTAGIPATQTIAVKVRESITGSRNVLHPIIHKGDHLPTGGEAKFKSARILRPSEKEECIDFEVYQDEGAEEAELNKKIGSFRIYGRDLEEGMKIRNGDDIIFHWAMSDSGLLQVTLELPAIGQTFDTPKFYAPQTGHQDFGLEHGPRLARQLLLEAEGDLKSLRELVDSESKFAPRITELSEDIKDHRSILENTLDAEVIKSVAEHARDIRQDISRIANAPENKIGELRQRILVMQSIYQDVTKFLNGKEAELFAMNAAKAAECLERGQEKDIKDAELYVEALRSLVSSGLWRSPDFLASKLQEAIETADTATDKDQYQALVGRARAALQGNDFDELRLLISKLRALQPCVDCTSNSWGELASIVRG